MDINKSDRKVFSPSKLGIHADRINAFLKGERIYPVTMELDLTQRCTRICPACPHSLENQNTHTLQLPFLNRLFSVLGPHTKGIALSGGEATSVPHFPETVALARAKGFEEIAIMSNGYGLHIPVVQDALLKHVTSLRVSMYDYEENDSESFLKMLEKMKFLRDRAKKEGSGLRVAASMLTRAEWVKRIKPACLKILNSGVDWLYFHPYCVDWEAGRPVQADQTGVLDAIEELKRAAPPGSNIQVPYERYSEKPLFFKELHGAHFLLVVGADGINYAEPGSKYVKEYALLDLNKDLDEGFLWNPQRINRLKEINSDNLKTVKTRHRGTICCAYLEELIQAHKSGLLIKPQENEGAFLCPKII